MKNRAVLYLYKEERNKQMAQYKSYTHVLRIDKDEVQGILCGDVVVMLEKSYLNAVSANCKLKYKVTTTRHIT